MEQYKKEFIEFMIDCDVLKFGDFVTKSGRNTPFFVNTGFYRTGAQLRKLGEYYAKAIEGSFGLAFDVLFGPAYMERGQGTKSALAEIEEKYGLKTTAIVTMEEVTEHLYNRPYKGKVIIDDTLKSAIDAYYKQYGVK